MNGCFNCSHNGKTTCLREYVYNNKTKRFENIGICNAWKEVDCESIIDDSTLQAENRRLQNEVNLLTSKVNQLDADKIMLKNDILTLMSEKEQAEIEADQSKKDTLGWIVIACIEAAFILFGLLTNVFRIGGM